jgi:hypothetical protein
MAKSARYYVRIGGAVGDIGESKFGFVAPEDSYEGIADELGVVKISDKADAKGVLFGANYPRPPKVRINYVDTRIGADAVRSTTRYCDPDKIGSVLNGSLNDAAIIVGGETHNIKSVSMPG